MDHSTHQRFLEEDMRRLETLIAQAARADAGLQGKSRVKEFSALESRLWGMQRGQDAGESFRE